MIEQPTLDNPRFRRVEHLATTQRRDIQGARIDPEPPRGVKFSGGTATWEEPAEIGNVTHYVIYANDENNLERRVPVGQKRATAIVAERVFVSSFNLFTGLESRAVLSEGSVATGPVGEEYAAVVTSFAVTQAQILGESGVQFVRFTGTVGIPTSPNYGGARIVAKVDGRPGIIWVADLTATQTDFESPLYPKTTASQSWIFYALSRNLTGSTNSISDPGTTPKDTETVAQGTGTLDLARAISTSYNTTEFEVVAGVFRVKEISASKLRPGILSIGWTSNGSIVQALILNTTGTTTGFIGDDTTGSGFQGMWMGTARLSGASASAARLIASSGAMSINDTAITGGTITNAVVYNDAGGVITTLNPSTGFTVTNGAKTISLNTGDVVVSGGGGTSTISDASVNTPLYKISGTNGVDYASNIVTAVGVSSTTLNYKDHGGVNQSLVVVTAVTPTTAFRVFQKGILTT